MVKFGYNDIKSQKEIREAYMIDFREEISKYKPIRPIDDVEEAVRDEVLDIMDLLQYISGKITESRPRKPGEKY